MGDVGNFLFGGSKQDSTGQNSSNQSSSSSNNSSNSSSQGSINSSVNSSGSASNGNSANQAYDSIAAAMNPTLGFTAAGGNMLGALLGIPGYSATKGPAPAAPVSHIVAPTPATVPTTNIDLTGDLSGLADILKQYVTPPAPQPSTTPAPAPTPAPTPTPSPTPTPTPTPTPAPGPLPYHGFDTSDPDYPANRIVANRLPGREQGGPVTAGQPYVVGEKRPEVFVPHTDGHIVPTVPGMPAQAGRPQMDMNSWLQRPFAQEMMQKLPDFNLSSFANPMQARQAFVSQYAPDGDWKSALGRLGITNLPGQHAPIQPRAAGGPVTAGQPYLVGENQPETFVPGNMQTMLGSDGRQRSDQYYARQAARDARHNPLPMPGPLPSPSPLPAPAPVPTPTPLPPVPAPTPAPVTPTPVTPASTTAAGGSPQQSALNTFFNSAGGKFLMDTGTNAINSNASANGVFQSGATGKALEKYGQGLASQYMNDYINHVLDFSKLGLGGASAMSGAGGVSNNSSQSAGGGSSGGISYGNSSGSSTGSSTSTGTSTGTTNSSGDSKKGLVPDILG